MVLAAWFGERSRLALNKDAAMLYAIKKFKVVPGKKALQKILYFANIKTDAFSFQWNNFGPYSEELNFLFEDAAIDGVIEVTPKSFPNSEILQYNMRLSDSGLELLNCMKIDRKVKAGIDFAYRVLKGKTPRKMELLASVHYIIKNNDCNTDPRYVWEIITMLKPEQGFTQDDIISAIKELQSIKLI